MEAKKAKKNKVRGIKNAFIVIIICFIVALVVFTQVLGVPENFEGGDPAGGRRVGGASAGGHPPGGGLPHRVRRRNPLHGILHRDPGL